jgi:phospholipid/cholesterol/gamma-HCH transport system substrate-binding protein
MRGEIRLGITEKVAEKLASRKLDKIMANADVLISGINNVLDEKHKRI